MIDDLALVTSLIFRLALTDFTQKTISRIAHYSVVFQDYFYEFFQFVEYQVPLNDKAL